MYKETLISLAIAACWSLSTIANKIALKNISVEVVYALTATISFLTSWTIIFWKGATFKDITVEMAKQQHTTILLIVSIAFIISVIARYVFLELLKKTKETYILVALTNTVPLFVALASWLILKEKVTKIGIIGLIITVVGIATISLSLTKT
jgi:drug/metabolite transporter (DMT)-like permease